MSRSTRKRSTTSSEEVRGLASEDGEEHAPALPQSKRSKVDKQKYQCPLKYQWNSSDLHDLDPTTLAQATRDLASRITEVWTKYMEDNASPGVTEDKLKDRSATHVPEAMQDHVLGWTPCDDISMTNRPRSLEEAVVKEDTLHPHLCRDILQGFLERDGLVPDAIQCDERLMHMVSHIVREHGVIVIKSPSVQQMHVVEVLDVSFSRPEGKQSRNYVCPITATEAMLTRNSYQVTVLLNMRHSVYVPEAGHRIEGLLSSRTGGARTSQTICSSMPGMDNPDIDVLADTDDPRSSVSLWSSCAAAGRIAFCPEPGYRLVSVKLLTNHVLTTLTAAVGGIWCHLSDGPTRSMDDLFDLGVKRIVKGQCKILLQQEQPAFNFITVHRGMTGRASWVASLRARPQSKMRSTSTTYVYIKCGDRGIASEVVMWCTLPYVKMDIPPLAIFRILGVANSAVAARMIASAGVTNGKSEFQEGSVFASPERRALETWVKSALLSRKFKDSNLNFDTATDEDIMIWIAKNGTTNKTPVECVRHLKHLIANEFMPCMGLSSRAEVLDLKARVFALVIYKICMVARGDTKPDNRDHCGNKQVDGAADLLAQLIRQQHRNVVRSFAAHARAQIDASGQLDVARSFIGRRIGDHEAYSLSTGNWGLQKGGSTQKGAAQHQTRQGYACTVSQLRRVSMQVDRKGKHAMPRQVSITAWGYICPVESPEGHACGLVKALALLARICPSRPYGVLWLAVRHALGSEMCVLGQESPGQDFGNNPSIVWINGVMAGSVRRLEHARKLLVEKRRCHAIPYDTEIFTLHGNELHISADAGGLRRPLIILEPPYNGTPDGPEPDALTPDEIYTHACARLAKVRDVMARNQGRPLADSVNELLYEGCVEYVGPRECDNIVIKLWAGRDTETWEEEDDLLQTWGSDDEDEVADADADADDGFDDDADDEDDDENDDCTRQHEEFAYTQSGTQAMSRLRNLQSSGPGSLGLAPHTGFDPVTCPRPDALSGADLSEPVRIDRVRLVDKRNGRVCADERRSAFELCALYRAECMRRARQSIDASASEADVMSWLAVEQRAAADLAYDIVASCKSITDTMIYAVPHLLLPRALQTQQIKMESDRARVSVVEYVSRLRHHIAQTGDPYTFAVDVNAKSSGGRSAGKTKSSFAASSSSKRDSVRSDRLVEKNVRDDQLRRARREYLKADRAKRRAVMSMTESELMARKLYEKGVPEVDILRFYTAQMRARRNKQRWQSRRRPRLSRWEAAPYTHAEIHPTAVYGFTTSLLVLFSHNQAPRNAYSDAMIKAAQGIIRDKNYTRGSTSIWYPQRPVVCSHASRVFGMDRHASGSNPMIVVLSDMGDNQEDSKTVSQNFIDSGGLRTAIHRAYVEEARDGFSADSQKFKLPNSDCLGVRAASYDHIDKETAAVLPGQVVRGGDALICKVMLVADIDMSTAGAIADTNPIVTGVGTNLAMDTSSATESTITASPYAQAGACISSCAPTRDDLAPAVTTSATGVAAAAFTNTITNVGTSKVMRERDQSVIARSTEGASIVEAVLRTSGRDGKSYVVVSTREMRIPQRGDKITNRHGQKGVMSVVMPPDDLPYTKDGVTPDVALNPHAIPSRMTCGMFFEMMASKAGVMEGIIVDGTVHDTPVTPELILHVLKQNGFDHAGEEKMYSGRTGKPLRGYVAIGPSHEHRLRQMVKDKIATRETGPVTPLCGQPVEGRSRYGGLRVGEMERDCLIAHGASAVILDRMLEQSDDSIGAVCKKCGLLAIANKARMPHASVENTGAMCVNCNTGEHVRSVRFPKAWKVLMQEMLSMNVRPSLVLEDDPQIDYGSAASVGIQVCEEGQVRVPLIVRKKIDGSANAAASGGLADSTPGDAPLSSVHGEANAWGSAIPDSARSASADHEEYEAVVDKAHIQAARQVYQDVLN